MDLEVRTLVARAQAGEAEAFGQLYELFAPKLYAYLFFHLNARAHLADQRKQPAAPQVALAELQLVDARRARRQLAFHQRDVIDATFLGARRPDTNDSHNQRQSYNRQFSITHMTPISWIQFVEPIYSI